ncbi:MAG: DUF998 domain-containing protein [Bacteroidetes bacterium]|nr:DUF998 domain-containing protein [Fibrella sp.]
MTILKRAGMLFFLAGSVVLMGIITAEAVYPAGYSTANSQISDLGSTIPPASLVYQPSASIFNGTMLAAGFMVLIATWYLHRFFRKWLVSIPLSLFGLGLVGIGFFPGNHVPYHGMSAMLAFLSGGVSAIAAATISSATISYVGIALGSIALTTWFIAVLWPNLLFPFIGDGGTERWVAYPIMLWLIGFGGCLMNEVEMMP